VRGLVTRRPNGKPPPNAGATISPVAKIKDRLTSLIALRSLPAANHG